VVSQEPDLKDSISIHFDKSVFQDEYSDFEVNDGLPLIVALPRQLNSLEAETIQLSMSGVKGTASTVGIGATILSIFLSFSLMALWDLINIL